LPRSDVRAIAIDGNGNKWIGIDTGLVVYNKGGVIASVERTYEISRILDNFRLEQNYPNPFNSATTIQYTALNSSFITLMIFNQCGQEITTLINKIQAPGEYSVMWDGQEYSSGIYIYQLRAGEFTQTKKLLLQK
jgi:hypothetical protein